MKYSAGSKKCLPRNGLSIAKKNPNHHKPLAVLIVEVSLKNS